MSDILFPEYEDNLEPNLMGCIDLDDYMACSTIAIPAKGVTAEHLSKIWRITLDEAA